MRYFDRFYRAISARKWVKRPQNGLQLEKNTGIIARKASNTANNVSLDIIKAETTQFAENLALLMKIFHVYSSKIFASSSHYFHSYYLSLQKSIEFGNVHMGTDMGGKEIVLALLEGVVVLGLYFS